MKKRKEQLYESPQVKMFETKVYGVLYASGDGNLQQYGDGIWLWDVE